MRTIEIITLHGRPVALVAGDQAIIPEHLSDADHARVAAKALYAIEIATGQRLGPYTDTDAEAYARSIATASSAPGPSSRPQPGRRRPTARRRRRGL